MLEFIFGFIFIIFNTIGPILIWPCIFILIRDAVREGLDDAMEETRSDAKEKSRFKGTNMFPIIFLSLYTLYFVNTVLKYL